MSFTEENVVHKNCKKLKSINYKSSSFVEEDLSTKCLSATFCAIEKFVTSVKFTLFKENFMDIYESNPGHLESIYEQFREQIFHKFKEDATEMYTEHDTSISLFPFGKLALENNNFDQINRRGHHKRLGAHSCHEKTWHSKLQSDNKEREDEILRNHEHILILKNRIQILNEKIMEELDKLYEIALQVAV